MKKVRHVWRRIRCATAPDDATALCFLVGVKPRETTALKVEVVAYRFLRYEAEGMAL